MPHSIAHSVATTSASFSTNKLARYYCCCPGLRGALILAIIEACFFALFFIFALYDITQGSKWIPLFVISLIWLLCVLAALILLRLGLTRHRKSYFLPHIALSATAVLFFLLWGILLVVSFTSGGSIGYLMFYGKIPESGMSSRDLSGEVYEKTSNVLHQYVTIAATVCCFLAVILEVWFFFVLRGCYRYLKDRDAFRSSASVPIRQVVTQTPNGVGLSNHPRAQNGSAIVYRTGEGSKPSDSNPPPTEPQAKSIPDAPWYQPSHVRLLKETETNAPKPAAVHPAAAVTKPTTTTTAAAPPSADRQPSRLARLSPKLARLSPKMLMKGMKQQSPPAGQQQHLPTQKPTAVLSTGTGAPKPLAISIPSEQGGRPKAEERGRSPRQLAKIRDRSPSKNEKEKDSEDKRIRHYSASPKRHRKRSRDRSSSRDKHRSKDAKSVKELEGSPQLHCRAINAPVKPSGQPQAKPRTVRFIPDPPAPRPPETRKSSGGQDTNGDH